MSRFRSSNDDLAYGEIPQRWDRERFERFGQQGRAPAPTYEDDFRFTERDRPGRREITVAERRESSRPGGRFEERERFFEEDRTRSRPRRRTDRELFGEVDPREIADMALMPYRRSSVTKEDIEFEQKSPRPGLVRRQSSLDTFDRRPARYEREEYRIPPGYAQVLVPASQFRGGWDDRRYRDDEPEDYREVEITRERSIHRRRPPKSERSVKDEKEEKISYHHSSRHGDSSSSSSTTVEEEVEEVKSSKAPSRRSSRATTVRAPSTKAPSTKAKSTRASSVHESIHETTIEEDVSESSSPSLAPVPSIHESFHETAFEESVREERKFKKGKTRMPKRLVRREAIMDLGYPFDEEEDFFVLRIALEKEQIDEVIHISETYKDGEKRKVYKFEEESKEINTTSAEEREEIQRTEWINPPSVAGSRSHRSKSIRDTSPNVKSSVSQRLSPPHTSKSRRPSEGGTFFEERKTIVEETRSPSSPSASRAPSAPPPPSAPDIYEERKTIIEERSPSHHHHGTLVLAERDHRSDRDINAEIRALEQERRALRYEREAEEKRELALRVRERPHDELELVQYRSRSRPREELVLYERESSPSRNVIRVEKDRKERRQARLLAAAMATLT